MAKLAPSILSADFSALGRDIRLIDASQAAYIHIDVMDGLFVPNLSFGMPIVKAIRKDTTKPFDVHLMIQEPDTYLAAFRAAGADILTVHAEACAHLHRTVQAIRALGAKACVALNPATPLSALRYVLPDLDMVLLMTVEPGFGGAAYIPAMTRKISDLREMIQGAGLSTEIEVDGGITLQNAAEVIRAGADVLVAGSAVFHDDISANISHFYQIFQEADHE
ncbi:MAG: ribulose-phosphate 3-epimerase [Oscillospiraceae bacterium]|jgi:ribulose-phosphate 3-epimerase|nr:ribulose-phosphate 3-epimerase [Oscillospiraceae bacterium]MDD3260354.1 ribulose-phosphate 3-epimerase [Oscillospiraceae bacterium]